jgi:flagellar assembly protein FliH
MSDGNPSQATPGAQANGASPLIEIFVYPQAPWSEPNAGWAQAFGRAGLRPVSAEGSSARNGSDGRPTGDGISSRNEHGTDLNGASGPTWNHAAPGSSDPAGAWDREAFEAGWARRLAEESHRAEERGRREGLEAGVARGREEALQGFTADRERLFAQGATLAESFAQERGQYFHRVEQEAVRLALAIAARILRREAQMDPLLLTGAVRVALGQLAQSTMVRLFVPLADQALWEEALARMPKLEQRPLVVGDPEMKLGGCRMETELGSADLSLWSQLKEIEHGFFDRVGAQGAVEAMDVDEERDWAGGEERTARARRNAERPDRQQTSPAKTAGQGATAVDSGELTGVVEEPSEASRQHFSAAAPLSEIPETAAVREW